LSLGCGARSETTAWLIVMVSPVRSRRRRPSRPTNRTSSAPPNRAYPLVEHTIRSRIPSEQRVAGSSPAGALPQVLRRPGACRAPAWAAPGSPAASRQAGRSAQGRSTSSPWPTVETARWRTYAQAIGASTLIEPANKASTRPSDARRARVAEVRAAVARAERNDDPDPGLGFVNCWYRAAYRGTVSMMSVWSSSHSGQVPSATKVVSPVATSTTKTLPKTLPLDSFSRLM